MTTDKIRRLAHLANQLAETLMTAAICAQEIRAEIHEEISHTAEGYNGNGASPRPWSGRRPLLDETTLCVLWRGQSLHLGHTVAYRLLDRLARRPNQYVTHTDLIRDVWDDNELLATATIRSSVRNLRRCLEHGGMEDLARAIRGHDGRYIIDL